MSNKYSAYPEYKSTGVSWLPEMPQCWKSTKLKYLIKALESGVSVNAADYPKSKDEIGVLKTSCVYTREFRADENKTVFKEEVIRVKCPVKAGSIIISRMNTPDLVGAAAYVDADYKDLYLPDRLWQAVYNDEELQSSKYVHYFMYLRGFRDQISNYAEGASSSMQNIAKEDFLSINLLLPSLSEQQTIANFLDHETAKIDTLIDKQQQLITLLKEKRQAVISHAITKGLDPNAPMRDSGVEWLGEVPEGWNMVPIKHISKIQYGIGEPPKYQDQGIPLIRATNIRSGKISDVGLVLVNPDHIPENRIVWLDEGDIIVVRSGAGTGDSSIIPEEYQGSIAGFDMVVRPTICLPKFLGHVLLSKYVRNNQIDLEKTRAAQPHLNAEELGECFVLLPTNEEQLLIVTYIDREILKFDELVSKVDKAIFLMQERRTGLISAAVTGKIDVRNWQSLQDDNAQLRAAV